MRQQPINTTNSKCTYLDISINCLIRFAENLDSEYLFRHLFEQNIFFFLSNWESDYLFVIPYINIQFVFLFELKDTTVTVDLLIFVGTNNRGLRKISCSWIFKFVVLFKFAYKPSENLSFVEHLILWFNCIHENWYPTNNNESTVIIFGLLIACCSV